MSSDSEDEYLFESSALKWFVVTSLPTSKKFHRHPINTVEQSGFVLFQQLKNYPEKFFDYLRMAPEAFAYILQVISPALQLRWQNCHGRPIQLEERLVITLRYLATGASFRSLAFSYRMGFSPIAYIVKTTVKAIWKALQPLHMPVPTKEKFIEISDADYKFIIVEVGGYGKQSEGGTFRSSSMFKLMQAGGLNIPSPNFLPHTTTKMPYVFIGDEAYPLLNNLLKPYRMDQLNDLNNEIFNKRLSRARKTVECAFGIINSKWRILGKSIETNECTAEEIVKAICVLHNTVIDKEGFERHIKDVTISTERNPEAGHQIGRQANDANLVRETFNKYFSQNPITYSN